MEDTNHEHLGKIITYASGKSADVIIWVVKRAREEHKTEIENITGFELDWRELPEKKASRILTSRIVDFGNENKWLEQFDWIMDTMIKMKKAFKKYL